MARPTGQETTAIVKMVSHSSYEEGLFHATLCRDHRGSTRVVRRQRDQGRCRQELLLCSPQEGTDEASEQAEDWLVQTVEPWDIGSVSGCLLPGSGVIGAEEWPRV